MSPEAVGIVSLLIYIGSRLESSVRSDHFAYEGLHIDLW
jgi:hypothetical protein